MAPDPYEAGPPEYQPDEDLGDDETLWAQAAVDQAEQDADEACVVCGRTPAAGYARGFHGGRLCHPDPWMRPDETGPDCYHLTQGGRRG